MKYGVTYQAVSKWENGKNIPDITILKQMCREYNVDLNDLLEGNEYKVNNNNNKIFIIMAVIILIIISVFLVFIFNKKDNDFEFKKLSTTCENFDLYGSIAYSDSKTSIYISNINYCGESGLEEFKSIECTLFESDDNTKTKISSYSYSDKKTVSLKEFLKNVNFSVEHYSKSCKMYKENSLYLEIIATKENNDNIFYNIPLKLEDNCNE